MSLASFWDLAQKNSGAIVFFILAAATIVQVTPIKINPWSTLFGWIGKAINGEVLKEIAGMRKHQKETRELLDNHITMDDQRDADLHRYRILRFNTEVLRSIRHTKEEFDEILYNIKCYEHYCRTHPDYENNRAVLAIENIERVYKKCMEENDFLAG